MKHMGKVRFGIRARIISLMIVVNVMICLVMGVLLLKRVKINYIKQGTREAITTSRLISQMIDVEDIKEIITSKEMNDAYQNVKKVMQKATDNSKAEYIYLVGKVENELVYIVDTSVEDDRYAPVEKEYYEEINQVLSGKTYQSDAIEYGKYGALLTASTPILSEEGETLAALAVDYNASMIDNNIDHMIVLIIICGCILCIISVILSLVLMNRVINYSFTRNESR